MTSSGYTCIRRTFCSLNVLVWVSLEHKLILFIFAMRKNKKFKMLFDFKIIKIKLSAKISLHIFLLCINFI